MDRERIFIALSHMDNPGVSTSGACELYAGTIADIAEKVSMDEMRRLLLIGAYLFNSQADKSETVDHLWYSSKERSQ